HREFEPLGSNSVIKADVRILAATNRDLEAAIASGSFREDLFHRLAVVSLNLPPLRDRLNDAGLLVASFLEHFDGEIGKPDTFITADAREKLPTYSWPGNVRELENCLQRLTILCQGRSIQPSDVEQAIHALHQSTSYNDGLQTLIRGLIAR